ncbi:MAG: UMP kinase, partial [Candidatus Pacebacteria bacterium]|nr:UMP kinase [Candidatus Paceibacterota bacterium]
MEKETFIISLGGSLIVPNEIDIEFLKSFKELIIKKINEGNRFVIVTGGGKICRKYQDGAKELSNPSNEDLDWIGIASLRLNAELIRVIFEEYAHHIVVKNFEDEFDFDKSIIVGSA